MGSLGCNLNPTSVPGTSVLAQTEPHGQSFEFQHLQDTASTWQVLLVARSLPVSLSGQHTLLLAGHLMPLLL